MTKPEWILMIDYLQDIRLFSHLLNKRNNTHHLLNKEELDLLSNLIISDQLFTPVMLSNKMGISKPLVSRLIELLNKKELVKKCPNPHDKRSYYVKITPLGQQYLNEIYTYYLEPIYQLKHNLTNEEFTQLISLIKKANLLSMEENK